MDKKKGLLNVFISLTFKLILFIVNLWVRRYLIKYIGNEINGINSLFLSILDFLSVAELGVGTAITFCMYKPIVEGDNGKVSALYGLFKRVYFIIGSIILICGFIIMPLLPFLAKDYQTVDVNLYFTFGLTLISVVLTYAFSSKTSLINAYKNNYITTTINSCGMILQCVLQIIVLYFSKSFVWFLVCRIIAVLFQWLVTEIIARKRYGKIIKNKQAIDKETKSEVIKNVKAMFMHKIGGVLVNTADSVIISAFIGIVVLGKYSNYNVIMSALFGIITLCFTPLTSVIGHMFIAEESSALKYFNFFHTANFILGIIFYLGYFSVIDNVVRIIFGLGIELAKPVTMVITLNGFIQFMRQAVLLFRDSSGTFYYDRWKCVIEGLFNIALSILFVIIFPPEFKVVGVIVATIITNLFICHIVEPHVLYKYAFHTSTKNYYIRNYIYMAIFLVALVALHFCMVEIENPWLELLVNGSIAVGIALVPCILVMLFDKDFKIYLHKVFTRKKANKEV